MSKLSAFLHPVVVQEEKEVVISKRFQDENGKPVPFKIRSVTQEENEKLRKAATRISKVNGQRVETFEPGDYSARLVVLATLEPNFSAKEMCEAYGVLDPLLVPGKMLLGGEYAKLATAINKLSGFDDSEEGEAAIEEAVKN